MVDFDRLRELRKKIGISGQFEVYDLDDGHPHRRGDGSGAGTVWHYGVRGVTHGIDPVALHMGREGAEFLVACLNALASTTGGTP